MLLDELAEQQFRKIPSKIKDLKEIDEQILKVYGLIDKVGEELKAKGVKD
jgi:hypothetical protein